MLYTSRNKQSVSLLEWALVAHVHLIPKEELVLIGGGAPALKQRQVSRRRTDQVENLLALSQKMYSNSLTRLKTIWNGLRFESPAALL